MTRSAASFNVLVDQRPAAVVFPESARDVAAAVRFAAGNGQRVVAQGTGHNMAPQCALKPVGLSGLMPFGDQVGIQAGALQAGACFVAGEDLLGIAVEGMGLGVECALP
jgi:FAD binding domain